VAVNRSGRGLGQDGRLRRPRWPDLLSLGLASLAVMLVATPAHAIARAPSPWPSMRHDHRTGTPKWTFATHDSIYSSPALGHDSRGTTSAIYIASTDGSVYALSTAGRLRWTYDTGEAIRSSPVLGPGPGGDRHEILYIGSSDGSPYALDAQTGRRRWSFSTVSVGPILRDRHQTNSSPALGRTGVYIGSEDGHLWYVPYDYCLHRSDRRCDTDPGEPYPARISRVYPVTAGGTTERSGGEGPVPSSAEITGRLIVRRAGQTVYASMLPAPTAVALVRTEPRFSLRARGRLARRGAGRRSRRRRSGQGAARPRSPPDDGRPPGGGGRSGVCGTRATKNRLRLAPLAVSEKPRLWYSLIASELSSLVSSSTR
jgi:hypothetical protein